MSWSNYVCLGCPDCDGSVHEPRACYRSCADARQFADQLLGEIVSFGSPSFLSGKVICEGKRRSTDEMLDHLRSTVEGYQLPKDVCVGRLRYPERYQWWSIVLPFLRRLA